MHDDEMDIEDILENANPKKKKIKTGQKGKRVERDVVHLLNTRFQEILSKSGEGFSRSIGSGNRWGQGVMLSAQAKQTFSGDIACPTNFIWTIESKGGYNDIDLNSVFDGGNSTLNEFIKQVSDDAERTSRKPIILWKKDRRPRLAILKLDDVKTHLDPEKIQYFMHYREWVMVNFDFVLTLPDEFFFKTTAI